MMQKNKFSMVCLILMSGCFAAVKAQELPATPAPVLDLIAAVPFSLDTPYSHLWRADPPQVSSGYVLVLAVDPDLVVPRQTYEPVLYVGHQTAERVNAGNLSGTVIAIVPGVTDDPNDPDYIDLNTSLIWFGTPELPERVTPEEIDYQHDLAATQRIAAFSPAQVQDALTTGGPALHATHKTELFVMLSSLVATYAPEEKDLIARLSRLMN